MKTPTVEELFNLGAHFGHMKAKSHPGARDYVYGIVNRVYVIDLEKTIPQIKSAVDFITNEAKQGKKFLVVGTKKQAKEAVEKTCKSKGIAYVSNKWLGGTLTNFNTIKNSLKKMNKLDEIRMEEGFKKTSKKYQSMINTEVQRLHRNLDGIVGLTKVPDVLIAIDIMEEKTAIKEAKSLKIPVVGIVDTNSNPNLVDYPILANDDSFKTVACLVDLLTGAIEEGAKSAPKEIKKEDN